MRTIAHRVLGIAILFASLSGVAAPAAAVQEQSYKPGWLVETAEKASFTDDDRKLAREWLASHPELRPAPRSVARTLREADDWSADLDGCATRLPRRLEQQFSPLPERFVRRVLDRSIWLICVDSGEIVDHIDEK